MPDDERRRAFPHIAARPLRPRVVGLTISDTEYALLPGDVAAAQDALRNASRMPRGPADEDPTASPQRRARSFVQRNLAQAAAEIAAWRRTGLLQDGVVRKVGAILEDVFPEDFLQQAEALIVKESLDQVAGGGVSGAQAKGLP